MKLKITTFLLVLALIFMTSLINVNAQIGIGVSPSEIVIDNALRGGEYEKRITIFNGSDNDGNFYLSATGSISDWFSFYDENGQPINLITIKGKSSEEVFVRVNVSDEAANENYSSRIYIEMVSEGEGGTQVRIGIDVDVMIEVTGTQILRGIVEDIYTTDTEVNYPLFIYIRFRNTGNVIVKPKVSVNIRTLDDFLVDNLVFEDKEVKPEKVETIVVDWDTTGTQTGDYKAYVNVTLGDNLISEKELSFKILPEGTLTRGGELLGLSKEGEALVGRYIKIFALFKNTGEISTNAMLICEIYKDGGLIDVENSLKSLFLVGEEDTLMLYVKIESYGDYLIKGYVTYDGKTTDVKELSFSIVKQETSPLIKFLAIAVVVSLPTVYAWNNRRKKLRKKSRHQ